MDEKQKAAASAARVSCSGAATLVSATATADDLLVLKQAVAALRRSESHLALCLLEERLAALGSTAVR